MRIRRKYLISFMSILFLMLLILALNFRSVGKRPELYDLSIGVANPGDTITLYGNYFGGEISRGRVYINQQMVYTDAIESWSNREILLTLSDDFLSGMITVHNMFGKSNPYLITNIKDVPKIEFSDRRIGLPFIESVKYDDSDLKIVLTGSSFGVHEISSRLKIFTVSGEEIHLDSSQIVDWSDESITLYLPCGINNIVLTVINNIGESNEVTLHNSGTPSVLYINSKPKIYELEQQIDIKDVVALPGSSINIFVPSIHEGYNQKKLSIGFGEGVYNSQSNTYNYSIKIREPGEKVSLFLKSTVEINSMEATIRKDLIGRIYDKTSPQFKSGFQVTPNVQQSKGLKDTAVWIIRNSHNRYIQAKSVMNWVLKYIDITEDGSDNATIAFKNRTASSSGIVNIIVSMLRSVGIPSRVISGIDVSEKSTNYQWLEFFLPDGGWIPMDVIRIKSDSKYSIGRIDNNKISFSKGVTEIDYQDSIFLENSYALQNCSSNFEGNIEKYNVMWHNVRVK